VPIIAGDIDIVLLYDQPLRVLMPTLAKPEAIRDREHTNLFLEDIQARYPGGAPAGLVPASINAINAAYAIHPRITPALVAAEISIQAAMPVPAPPPVPAPVAPAAAPARRAALLSRMRARRGAYTWREGRTVDFTAWIHHAAPLANPISEDATINCWEAVLVAGAESGLLTIAQLTGAYGSPDPDAAVFNLLTHAGVQQINVAAGGYANNIQAGDVIMIEHVGHNLHHVMVALTANAADYRPIEVLSLWGSFGGFILTRAILEFVILPTTVFRYSTL
jgi:hypothetical protein